MQRTLVVPTLVLCVAMPAFASESFILNIPLRFNAQQETGEVRINLGLDAPPAGAQLVINDATTISLGDSVTASGDKITFIAGDGNEAKIIYQPLSNFAGDFCAGGGASEKNIPIRFSGSQDILNYRMSSYVVAAPAVECSAVSKRTGESPAFLIPSADAVAPELTAQFLGRQQMDVILVLDKSGSMSELPPGANVEPNKAEILESALKTFVLQWREIDNPVEGGGEWSKDRLGVVFFDTIAKPSTLAGGDPPSSFFVRRGSNPPGPSHAWNAVSANIATIAPGGTTALGAAINEAYTRWKADPLNDLQMLVVTDGKQNQLPLVEPAPSGFLRLPAVAGFPGELRKRFVPIQTIGFGNPDVVDAALLKDISLETSGVSFIGINAATVFDDLALTLVAILKGNTVGLVLRRSDSLTGAGPSAAMPVIIDRSAQRVTFSLQWAPPEQDVLDFDVFRRGASAPVTPSSTSRHEQAILKSFDLKEGDAGTWSVRVRRVAPRPDPAPYTLNAFVLEKSLDTSIAVEPRTTGTGDPIRVRATLSYDGRPLTKLPAGAVRVRVLRPAEALGTILHASNVRGGAASIKGDAETPYQRKLARLSRGNLIARIAPRDFKTITLSEEKNGVYTATLDDTSIPGVYAFEAILDWDDARTGRVHREERVEQHVTVKADPARSDVKIAKTGTRTFTVTVIPRDRFGNVAGPGLASRFRVTNRGKGTVSAPVDKEEKGIYVFTVRGASERPELDIVFDGVRLAK